MGGVYVTLWIGLIFSPITSALKGMSCFCYLLVFSNFNAVLTVKNISHKSTKKKHI